MKHRHKMHLFPLLKKEPSIKQIEDICDFVIKNLEEIKCTLYTTNNVDLNFGLVQNLIDGFKLVIEICSEPDYDHVMYLNEYLKLLYEVAHEEIHENGVKYKFILIE